MPLARAWREAALPDGYDHQVEWGAFSMAAGVFTSAQSRSKVQVSGTALLGCLAGRGFTECDADVVVASCANPLAQLGWRAT